MFDDNTNITFVVIPVNRKYCEVTAQKLRTEGKKLRTRDKINNSSNSIRTKNNLDKIYIALSNTIFSPKDIIELLNVAPNTATSYINKLKELDLLEKVEGIGQSKFKFK